MTAVVVAGAGALGIARLQQYAAQRQDLRIVLAGIKTSAWQQSALEWQAMAEQELTPTVAREQKESHLVAHALVDHLARRDPDSAEVRAVQAAFDVYYHRKLELEFTLLARGMVAEAQRVDKEEVDPAFTRLVTALSAADRAYDIRAAQAAAQARAGTILILAATAIIIGGVAWLRRAGSRAYGRAARGAMHDPMTGPPDRSLLQERAAEDINDADRRQAGAALLLVDLDGFRAVDDSRGDQLLVQAASCAGTGVSARRVPACGTEAPTRSDRGEVRDGDADPT